MNAVFNLLGKILTQFFIGESLGNILCVAQRYKHLHVLLMCVSYHVLHCIVTIIIQMSVATHLSESKTYY